MRVVLEGWFLPKRQGVPPLPSLPQRRVEESEKGEVDHYALGFDHSKANSGGGARLIGIEPVLLH